MRKIAPILLTLLAACADVPRTEASRQDLVITVRLQGAQLDTTRTFVHRGDDHHRCDMPGRIRLGTREKPTPSPDDPPNDTSGYSVSFGPDPSTVEDGGSTKSLGNGPGPPFYQPVVNYFALVIDPLPDQVQTSGPVKLSRSFRIEMTAQGPWRGRVDSDNKSTSSVTLDRDGLGGRFRMTNVEPNLTHNRAPESEYITVTGFWRCPAP